MSNNIDYRPNVKLALSTIGIKWDAQGKPLDYLLDAADADLVIDSLIEHGWSIIPTEIAEAAREVVEAHEEVQELTAPLGSFGPRFVQLGHWWVNPDAVAAVKPREADPESEGDLPGSYVIFTTGTHIWPNLPPTEVIAKLTGEPVPDPFSDSTPLVCSTDPGETCEACQ